MQGKVRCIALPCMQRNANMQINSPAAGKGFTQRRTPPATSQTEAIALGHPARQYTDRIEIGLVTESPELTAAIEKFREYIAQETLALKIVCEPLAGVEPVRVNLAGHELAIYLRVVK